VVDAVSAEGEVGAFAAGDVERFAVGQGRVPVGRRDAQRHRLAGRHGDLPDSGSECTSPQFHH
jgi:hypothetical protein